MCKLALFRSTDSFKGEIWKILRKGPLATKSPVFYLRCMDEMCSVAETCTYCWLDNWLRVSKGQVVDSKHMGWQLGLEIVCLQLWKHLWEIHWPSQTTCVSYHISYRIMSHFWSYGSHPDNGKGCSTSSSAEADDMQLHGAIARNTCMTTSRAPWNCIAFPCWSYTKPLQPSALP